MTCLPQSPTIVNTETDMTTQVQPLPRLDPHLIYGVDALVSFAMGVTLMLAADHLTALAGWTLPPAFLFTLGLLLVPWAAFNLWIARSAQPGRGVIRGNLASDAFWVLGSLALVAAQAASLTPLGFALVIGQAAAVAGVFTVKLIGAGALAR